MKPLAPDDRVFHPNKKDWGIGKVLSVTSAGISVFFVGAGHKLLSPQYVSLTHAETHEAHHPLLDNLSAAATEKNSVFLALPQAIQGFLDKYPDGFRGEKFDREERADKTKAHGVCASLLAEETITTLLAEGNYSDICERAKRVASTVLIARFEKMQLNDVLKNPEYQMRFAERLTDVLYGKEEEASRFERFSRALRDMNVAKWPIATYFRYIRFPDHQVFIKPEVTQNAAAVCGWEIQYKPELNWGTYKGVRGLFERLRDQLIAAGLAPRDMIDVQSFIWCIAPAAMRRVGRKIAVGKK